MAFYWVRWLRGDSQAVSVFLPGFKRDLLVDLRMTSSPSASGTLWRAPLHYPALEESPASNATALVSPDRRLSQLAFELHTFRGSGRGIVTQQGCEGTPVVPVGSRSAR
jgi:hypothetical protein